VAQKSITEMKNPSYSPDLAPSNFWMYIKINSVLKGRRFQDIKHMKKRDEVTEIYSTKGVSKMFPTVAASLG